MPKSLSKLFRHPLVYTPLGTVIAVGMLQLIDIIAGTKILKAFWSGIISVPSILSSFLSIKISLWILIIISIVFYVLKRIVDIRRLKNIKNDNNEPWFFKYTEDTFDDRILYRWNFKLSSKNEYEIENIQPYCPKCKCKIVYSRCPICRGDYRAPMRDNTTVRALIKHHIDMEEERIKKDNKFFG
ncbi:MAG: hypothetical protein ABII93_05745 [Chrysiogenia bacterium]